MDPSFGTEVESSITGVGSSSSNFTSSSTSTAPASTNSIAAMLANAQAAAAAAAAAAATTSSSTQPFASSSSSLPTNNIASSSTTTSSTSSMSLLQQLHQQLQKQQNPAVPLHLTQPVSSSPSLSAATTMQRGTLGMAPRSSPPPPSSLTSPLPPPPIAPAVPPLDQLVLRLHDITSALSSTASAFPNGTVASPNAMTNEQLAHIATLTRTLQTMVQRKLATVLAQQAGNRGNAAAAAAIAAAGFAGSNAAAATTKPAMNPTAEAILATLAAGGVGGRGSVGTSLPQTTGAPAINAALARLLASQKATPSSSAQRPQPQAGGGGGGPSSSLGMALLEQLSKTTSATSGGGAGGGIDPAALRAAVAAIATRQQQQQQQQPSHAASPPPPAQPPNLPNVDPSTMKKIWLSALQTKYHTLAETKPSIGSGADSANAAAAPPTTTPATTKQSNVLSPQLLQQILQLQQQQRQRQQQQQQQQQQAGGPSAGVGPDPQNPMAGTLPPASKETIAAIQRLLQLQQQVRLQQQQLLAQQKQNPGGALSPQEALLAKILDEKQRKLSELLQQQHAILRQQHGLVQQQQQLQPPPRSPLGMMSGAGGPAPALAAAAAALEPKESAADDPSPSSSEYDRFLKLWDEADTAKLMPKPGAGGDAEAMISATQLEAKYRLDGEQAAAFLFGQKQSASTSGSGGNSTLPFSDPAAVYLQQAASTPPNTNSNVPATVTAAISPLGNAGAQLLSLFQQQSSSSSSSSSSSTLPTEGFQPPAASSSSSAESGVPSSTPEILSALQSLKLAPEHSVRVLTSSANAANPTAEAAATSSTTELPVRNNNNNNPTSGGPNLFGQRCVPQFLTDCVSHVMATNPSAKSQFAVGWQALKHIWNISTSDFDATVLARLDQLAPKRREAVLLTMAAADLSDIANLSAFLFRILQAAEEAPQVCIHSLVGLCDDPHTCASVHVDRHSAGWTEIHRRWGLSHLDLDYVVLNRLYVNRPLEEVDAILLNAAANGPTGDDPRWDFRGGSESFSALVSNALHHFDSNNPRRWDRNR